MSNIHYEYIISLHKVTVECTVYCVCEALLPQAGGSTWALVALVSRGMHPGVACGSNAADKSKNGKERWHNSFRGLQRRQCTLWYVSIMNCFISFAYTTKWESHIICCKASIELWVIMWSCSSTGRSSLNMPVTCCTVSLSIYSVSAGLLQICCHVCYIALKVNWTWLDWLLVSFPTSMWGSFTLHMVWTAAEQY